MDLLNIFSGNAPSVEFRNGRYFWKILLWGKFEPIFLWDEDEEKRVIGLNYKNDSRRDEDLRRIFYKARNFDGLSVIDGGNLRNGISSLLGYTPEDYNTMFQNKKHMLFLYVPKKAELIVDRERVE